MQMPDVNALVYAHRGELPAHERYERWLYGLVNGVESYALTDVVTLGFLRLVTNRRVFADSTPVHVALEFVSAIRAQPQATTVAPGPRHWGIFDGLCQDISATGGDVTDAYLAALAIEHGHELVTEDRGFRRFPKLRVRRPE